MKIRESECTCNVIRDTGGCGHPSFILFIRKEGRKKKIKCKNNYTQNVGICCDLAKFSVKYVVGMFDCSGVRVWCLQYRVMLFSLCVM